jgi:hypothetical protein
MHDEHQIPVWFFIGALLLVYGVIITATGIYGLQHPSAVQISLREANPDAAWFFFHPDIWWGAVLTLLGAFYVVRFRPWREQD